MSVITLLLVWLASDVDLADRAYDDGRYAEALDHYLAIESRSEDVDRDLHYEIGHCYYRLGERSQALLYYLRAQNHHPRDQELAFNIRLIEDELDVPDEGDAGDELNSVFRRLTTRELLTGAFVLVCLAVVGWVLLPRHHGGRSLIPWVLGLGLLLASEVIYRQYVKDPLGVVLSKDVAIRSEPHSQVGSFAVLSAGMQVTVEAQSQHWALVTSPRGEGWVERKAIGVVGE